ncbi:ATP-binding protein [Amycolatopsis aidingensis]|uniref:ATP-binding protein n=1 Tax=Amycolatopsis aidingensis TaxID=2842453 RepID=UPI001C0C1482|nr:tetratricopeptide repeat protein [Amycolatopsis aidingensis]
MDTPRDSDADTPDEWREQTRSELSGRAADVVQARDVSGGVHFHQAAGPESASAPRQLPGDVRGFVDRMAELQRLDVILTERDGSVGVSALCVIVGTAGVGKTSFAVHWAHRVTQHFPDGQLYLNLRGYDPGTPVTSNEALERFLPALGVPNVAVPTEPEARATLYRSRLAGRRVLILLDNVSSAGQVRPLLPGTPGCLVLVTSRSRLSGLVARDGAQRVTLGVLAEPHAVSLVRGVARDHRREDAIEELTELSRLCARLPLALRIAAERAASRPGMPLRELIEELRDESALWDALTAGHDDESDAVRSVFAWSYRALSADAGRLFRLLGLHPGPEFGAAAAAALADIPVNAARRLLDDLAGAHLLEQPSHDRYQFHDLLRAYSMDQVREHEDATNSHAASRRILLWYLRMADAALATIVPGSWHAPLARTEVEPERFAFPGPQEAVGWYQRERANLVAAASAAQEAGMDDIAWQLPATLHRIYAKHNHFDDWRSTSAVALPAVRRLGDRSGEALCLESLAKLHTQVRELNEGIRFHRQALAVRKEIGDRTGEASSNNGIGLALLRDHRLVEARSYFEQARRIAVETAAGTWETVALNCLAYVHLELEEFGRALELNRQVLEFYRDTGDRGAEGDALCCASRIYRGLGRLADARASIEAAVMIAREHGNHAWEGWWLVECGHVLVALDRAEEALECFHRAARLQRRIGDRGREAIAWDGTGDAYRALGRAREAVDFHRNATTVFRQLGDRWRLAVSSNSLALSLAATGATVEAGTHWSAAEQALADFTDGPASRLRDTVRARPRETRMPPKQ